MREDVIGKDIPAAMLDAAKEGCCFRPTEGAKDSTWELYKPGPAAPVIEVTYANEAEAGKVDGFLGIQPRRERHPDGRCTERFKLVSFSEPRRGGGPREGEAAS